ncbi:MAG: NAD(P)-dependent oxidoreductase [Bryobacteraceae bacterium]
MKLVVTGSESFVGRALAALCRERGIEVWGVDTRSPRAGIRADITDPALRLPKADAVVHLAAISRDSDCRANPARALSVNVLGTQNIISAAREAEIPQVIFASSEWVYGDPGTRLIDESESIDINRVAGEYALTKLAGERLLALAAARGEIAATVLRFGIIYGLRVEGELPSAVESLFAAVRDTGRAEARGSLATARRFIHAADIAAGILAAVGRPGYDVFNLTGDRLVTLAEIARTSAEVCGRTVTLIEGDARHVSIRNIDNGKARATLGWSPRIDLRAGLESLAPEEVAA